MRKGMTTSEAGKLGAIKSAETAAFNKIQRIEDYNKFPKLCKFCETPISYDKRYNDFCNHSCAAKFNNLLKNNLSPAIEEKCLFCLNPLLEKGQHKYCSRKCMLAFHWQETKKELLSLGEDKSFGNHTGKKYLIELNEGKCQICGLCAWLGKPMPLVIDHIDGNPYNNLLPNLRVICNNCDALSDTFKARNKGNGRFKRAERYKYEKEAVGNIEGFKWKR